MTYDAAWAPQPVPTDPEGAVAWLTACSANPSASARAARRMGVPVVGLTSSTVPRELVEAVGCFPLVVRREPGLEVLAPTLLEADVFGPRITGVFEALVSGEWPFLSALVIPRSSEQEYKLFLYLRELVRDGRGGTLPPLFLFDLLQTQSVDARAYVRDRATQLFKDLIAIAGRVVSTGDVAAAVVDANRAARATAALTALRAGAPRITGVEALGLIGAQQFTIATHFAAAAEVAVVGLRERRPVTGPRIAVAGAPVDDATLHQAIESTGAVVVWEEDAGGVMEPRPSMPEDGDPLDTIAAQYYEHVGSARRFPPARADEAFTGALDRGVDGVVFHLPPDDTVAGWDYPRQARALDARGIPHFRLRESAAALTGDTLSRLAAFTAGLRRRA